MAEAKTNAMRILDSANIEYAEFFYEKDGEIDGISVAQKLNQDVNTVFKTLVTKGKKDFFVFVIPVADELDLKKAARTVGEKSIEMIAVKDINKTTGYLRGGCSPIGMKKQFQTVFHESAKQLEFIIFSGGRIGTQIKVSPEVVAAHICATFADIIK